MKHNFDEIINRKNIRSSKWDKCNEKFGVDKNIEMIPMWIADMDFNSPKEVVDVIKERASTGNYGYSPFTDSFYDAIVNWFKKRHNCHIEKEWIVFTPGVIPGFNIVIQNFTKENEGVIIQQPVYYPFMDAINNNNRKIVNNELIETDGYYTINFLDLENKCKDKNNKLMILSNPHNPVGRSWTKEELMTIGKICTENDVLLLSDEIHSDLTMKNYTHTVALNLSEEIKQNCIVEHSSSKTFNLAGLQTAYNIIPNENTRKRFIKGLNANRIFNPNWFGPIALETAFNNCDYYVDELCEYVDSNMDYMKNFIDTNIPKLKMRKSEATYMVWVDFRGTGMSSDEIEHFISHDAHIGVDYGSWFGEAGKGFLRFNLACPREIVEKAMNQLLDAMNKIFLR